MRHIRSPREYIWQRGTAWDAPVIGLGAAIGVITVALGMVLTPGPNMMYLVSRSVTQGRRAGLISLLGIAGGLLVYLFSTNLGLTVLFTVVPALYLAVKVAGACYLAWLAWKALKPKGVSIFTVQDLPPDSPRKLFSMGLVTVLLNPKMAVMYLSLIPQFINPHRGDILLQGFLLGGLQIAVSVSVNSLIVLAAGSISAFLSSRPLWLRLQRYMMGTVLGALAIMLLAQSKSA